MMPPLAPGEAVRSWPLEIWGAPAVYPPVTAPGFSAALRLGLLPAPAPEIPPSPVPGLSSWDRLRLALLLCLGVPWLVLVLGDPLGAGAWVMLVAGPSFLAGAGLLHSTRARDEVEYAAGYTSTRAHTGLWRLARDGRVLRSPDRQVPPPGWYPSPYYPGLLQRWDGPGWKPLPQYWWRREHQYFRVPDRPFL